MLEKVNPDLFGIYYQEIIDGKNSHMYAELLRNRKEFDTSTWDFGVNLFFVGQKITYQLMESRLLKRVEPEFFEYDKTLVSPNDLDEIRVREIMRGELRLPKKWDDLPKIAEKARVQIGNSLNISADIMQYLDSQTRYEVMEILATQPTRQELYQLCKTATTHQLENVLHHYLAQTQLSALTRSLDIISELRIQGKVEENLQRNHTSWLELFH